MSVLVNRQILLNSRPQGEPKPEDFRLVETKVPPSGEGQVLCRTIYLSLDPYMRGRMGSAKNYAKPVEIGGVMEGRTLGEVIHSNHQDFAEKDLEAAAAPGLKLRRQRSAVESATKGGRRTRKARSWMGGGKRKKRRRRQKTRRRTKKRQKTRRRRRKTRRRRRRRKR